MHIMISHLSDYLVSGIRFVKIIQAIFTSLDNGLYLLVQELDILYVYVYLYRLIYMFMYLCTFLVALSSILFKLVQSLSDFLSWQLDYAIISKF